MNGLFQTEFAGKRPYAEWVKALGGRQLPKPKRVFDSSKVTDHHAIIPTGIPPKGLTDAEHNVFDLIARRFIAAFYPDCKFSITTVLGMVDEVEFKASGKEILDLGWRAVTAPTSPEEDDVKSPEATTAGRQAGKSPSASGKSGEALLPAFVKGESGPHAPTLTEKQTTPPKHYTEASLLRAMETAGKLVDDDTLRAALKENGIGRPSSRAGIIETLFKRHYIRRKKKNLEATETGIALIDTIHEKLLTSAELTGIWEKKLRDIEHGKYDAAQFIDELKVQITNIVYDVLADNSNRKIIQQEADS
uniref:DNA topoisomerase n=1 Tax=Prevotella dentasini TaxID=589537 RepID=UPI000B219DE6